MAAGRFTTAVDHVLMVGHIKVNGDSALETFVLQTTALELTALTSLKSTYFVSQTYDGV